MNWLQLSNDTVVFLQLLYSRILFASLIVTFLFFFLSVSIEAGGRSWKTAAIISLSIISAILFAVVMFLLFKKTIKPYI